jgi:acetyl esterase/lipase
MLPLWTAQTLSGQGGQARSAACAPLTAASTLGELLRHPCLAGIGPLLLPRDDHAPDPALPLARIGSWLPYHAHVDPQAVVRGVNRLLEEAAAGAPPAYRFYPEEATRRDPARAGTGLFLFRGRPGAPFALICPGGGFQYVATLHEGLPVADAVARLGYNALVLKYRVGSGGAAATGDLAAALAWVFRHAGRLGLGTEGYSLWGFSAGARMAAAIATHGTARWGVPPLKKPAAVVIAYTGHQETGADEPPAFVVSGELDGIAPPAVMQRRVESLRRLGVQVEFRVFPGVGHGFGPGAGTAAEGWVEDAVRFWERVRKHSRKESR